MLMRKVCTLPRHGHASMTWKGVAREFKVVSFQPVKVKCTAVT